MITLKPDIFSNCLSAVMIGKPIVMADAAMMASGNLIFTFCLISITFFLMAGEISTTVHWLINALPVFRTFLTVQSKTWNGIKLGVFFIQFRWLGVSWESVYP
jgi:hypothetical protein